MQLYTHHTHITTHFIATIHSSDPHTFYHSYLHSTTHHTYHTDYHLYHLCCHTVHSFSSHILFIHACIPSFTIVHPTHVVHLFYTSYTCTPPSPSHHTVPSATLHTIFTCLSPACYPTFTCLHISFITTVPLDVASHSTPHMMMMVMGSDG